MKCKALGNIMLAPPPLFTMRTMDEIPTTNVR